MSSDSQQTGMSEQDLIGAAKMAEQDLKNLQQIMEG
jgi:hypothetical protein